MKTQDIEDYHSLILNRVPMMDVRAPIEYVTGHLPTAINLPIMNDDERAQVGTCYKEKGSAAAVALGHQLVSGANKADKMAAWQDFYHAHPNAVIYCARGGMRSQITQHWLSEMGMDIPRVYLGYKGLRRYLLSVLDNAPNHAMLMISGNTGTGKTDLLHEFSASIDLEGLANHHGSAFGKTLTAQPSQALFENELAACCVLKEKEPLWLIEDESRNIGKLYLPECFHQSMKQAPLVIIDEPLDHRLARISQLYFSEMSAQYQQQYGEVKGWQQYEAYLHHGLFAVQKRLGFERYRDLDAALTHALQVQCNTGDISAHINWLEPLLTTYYDPMYEYQLSQKQDRVLFRGNYGAIRDFVSHHLLTQNESLN